MFNRVKLCGAAALVGAAMLVGGCGGSQVTPSTVRHNWSPELKTLAEGPQYHKTMNTRTIDTNLRAMEDDLTRAILFDDPLGLDPYLVIPH